jgi:hemolysin activation/secretion protein
VISQAELEALTQPSVGHSLTLSGLEEVAASVAALYKQRGYTLATTYVPQ